MRICKIDLAETDAQDVLDKLLYADTKTYLHELLMKQDQMSMAASIESRVPFLDHRLVEYTARLPRQNENSRARNEMDSARGDEGNFADEILNRPKMGFPVPVGNWLRGEFRHVVDEYVLSERSLDARNFQRRFYARNCRAHQRGRKSRRKNLVSG